MKNNWWIFSGIISLLVLTPAFADAGPEDAQRAVTTKFVHAYFLGSLDELTPQIADSCATLFGAYPFKGQVVYGEVKVSNLQASLEFFANSVEGKYPPHGALIFKRLPKTDTWLVRQVLLYDGKPSKYFGLPDSSKSNKDRAYEAKVRQLGMDFMAVWEKNNFDKMKELWYDWTKQPRDPDKHLVIGPISLNVSKTAWADPFIAFTTKMSYKYGILSISQDVRGGVVLVKEQTGWRVRANLLVLHF